MAKYYENNGNPYVVVQKGDTLSAIAKKYGNGKTYQQLASFNGIANANKISVGQKIYLKAQSSSSNTTTSTNTASKKDPNITQFGLLPNEENTLYAAWTWSKESTTESYLIQWDYTRETGSDTWYTGKHESISVNKDMRSWSRESEFAIPDTARKVRFKLKPIAEKKDDKNNSDTRKWTATWSETKTYTVTEVLATPSAPSVKMEKQENTTNSWRLVSEFSDLSEYRDKWSHIQFQIIKDNASTVYHTSDKIKIVNDAVSYSYNIYTGSEYKVRCRSLKLIGTSTWEKSEWSAYSETIGTSPITPSKIESIRADFDDNQYRVYLTWTAVKNAESYDIQYTDNPEWFDKSTGEVKESTLENPPTSGSPGIYIIDFDRGDTYYFRVRANNEYGSSGWTPHRSITVGTKPAAPTTWSSKTKMEYGEEVYLYWVHNSLDESYQKSAEVDISVNGNKYRFTNIVNQYTDELEDPIDKANYITIKGNKVTVNTGSENVYYQVKYNSTTKKYTATDTILGDDPGGTQVSTTAKVTVGSKQYLVYEYRETNADSGTSTTKYYCIVSPTEEDRTITITDGTKIKWRVRTCGITGEYGPWSVERSIDVNKAPTLELFLNTTELVSFPLQIHAYMGGINQTPITYQITVTADEPYETVDIIGNPITVNAGDVVYSRVIDSNKEELVLELNADNVTLENSMTYTISATVTTNIGLSGTALPVQFKVSWDKPVYNINAETSIDLDTYTATIRPYCEVAETCYYKVTRSTSEFSRGSRIGTLGDVTYSYYEYYNAFQEDDGTYTKGDLLEDMVDAEEILDADDNEVFTATGDKMWTYRRDDDTIVYCCTVERNYYDGIQIKSQDYKGVNYYVYLRQANDTTDYYMFEYSNCNASTPIYRATPSSFTFVKTDELANDVVYGDIVPNAYIDGFPVYVGIDGDGELVYYYEVVETHRVTYVAPAYYLVESRYDSSISGLVYYLSGPTVTGVNPFLDSKWKNDNGKPVTITIDKVTYDVYVHIEDGYNVLYIKVEEGTPRVLMSVYRREFDGTFSELAFNIDGTNSTAISDPHPALDYARYRLVARDRLTGGVSFYDLPPIPVGGKEIVIQWDEVWSSFETHEDDEPTAPPWSGSLLKLPYNIDISEQSDPEAELIEYIGRRNPVSYYGTQRRQSASLTTQIPKSDKETIYQLRRLANWAGDVYVREPSGVGYWARITVSFSQNHNEVTVPVDLSITRVEGGI